MTAVSFSASDCQMPCDTDCEISPVHCWNWHRPGHKPDWHDPARCDREVHEGHAPKVERDEVLMAEVRDQYRDLGMDEDQIAEAVGVARDAGMFDVPDWA